MLQREAGEASPGADEGETSAVPAQMWQRGAASRRRCGRDERSRGADEGETSAVPAQMWQRGAASRRRCGRDERSRGADVGCRHECLVRVFQVVAAEARGLPPRALEEPCGAGRSGQAVCEYPRVPLEYPSSTRVPLECPLSTREEPCDAGRSGRAVGRAAPQRQVPRAAQNALPFGAARSGR